VVFNVASEMDLFLLHTDIFSPLTIIPAMSQHILLTSLLSLAPQYLCWLYYLHWGT